MSTATKLEYLNDTKGLLKDSINSLGGDITSQTTFRQYANELDSIYSRLPKVSGTGSSISLTPTLKGRLGSVLKGNTTQKTNLYTGSIEQGSLVNGSATEATNRIRTQDYISVIPNTTIPISFTGVDEFVLVQYGSDKSYRNQTGWLSSGSDYVISNNVYFIKLIFKKTNGSNITPSSISNLQIGNVPNPDYPQEIKSVTGLQNISVSGKNLFNPVLQIDGTNITKVNCNVEVVNNVMKFTPIASGEWYFGNVANSGSSYTNEKGILIEVEEGQKYSFKLSNSQIIKNFVTYYDENKVSLEFKQPQNYQFSYTIPTGVKYISFRFGMGASSVIVGQTYETTIQIEKGDVTSYEPYQNQEYEINLGNIHLYENDQIIGTPNNWSIVRENGEVVLDGDEGFSYTNGVFYKNNFISFNSSKVAYSNYFGYGGTCTNTTTAYNNGNNKISFNSNDNASIYLRNDDLTSSSAWNTWLSTHNVKVVYPLATPITELITDTDLIEDLNNLYYAMSNDDTTNISVSGNLPMILSVSALKGE